MHRMIGMMTMRSTMVPGRVLLATRVIQCEFTRRIVILWRYALYEYRCCVFCERMFFLFPWAVPGVEEVLPALDGWITGFQAAG